MSVCLAAVLVCAAPGPRGPGPREGPGRAQGGRAPGTREGGGGPREGRAQGPGKAQGGSRGKGPKRKRAREARHTRHS